MLVTAERTRTQMAKQAKSQFPEVCIYGALAQHRALRNVGARLMPTQEGVNFCKGILYEAAASDPLFRPYPAPKLAGS